MACPSTTKTTTTTTGSWKRKLPNLKSKLSPKEEALESTDLNILSIRALPIEKKRSQTPWHPRSVEKHISSYDMHISSLKYVYIYIYFYTTRNKSSQRFEATTKARLGKPLGLPWSVAVKLDGSSARWSCVRATSCSGQRLDGLGGPVDGQRKM